MGSRGLREEKVVEGIQIGRGASRSLSRDRCVRGGGSEALPGQFHMSEGSGIRRLAESRSGTENLAVHFLPSESLLAIPKRL